MKKNSMDNWIRDVNRFFTKKENSDKDNNALPMSNEPPTDQPRTSH